MVIQVWSAYVKTAAGRDANKSGLWFSHGNLEIGDFAVSPVLAVTFFWDVWLIRTPTHQTWQISLPVFVLSGQYILHFTRFQSLTVNSAFALLLVVCQVTRRLWALQQEGAAWKRM